MPDFFPWSALGKLLPVASLCLFADTDSRITSGSEVEMFEMFIAPAEETGIESERGRVIY